VVLLPKQSAVAFWLENESGTARLLARHIRNNSLLDDPFELSRGGNIGYPHAARSTDGILLTWAEKDKDAVSRVRVGSLKTTWRPRKSIAGKDRDSASRETHASAS
jgi:hypothetical protein